MDKGLKYPLLIMYSTIWEFQKLTFTIRISRRVYVVDLGDLLVSLLSGRIAKVNIDVDTTCVIVVWSSGTLLM